MRDQLVPADKFPGAFDEGYEQICRPSAQADGDSIAHKQLPVPKQSERPK